MSFIISISIFLSKLCDCGRNIIMIMLDNNLEQLFFDINCHRHKNDVDFNSTMFFNMNIATIKAGLSFK